VSEQPTRRGVIIGTAVGIAGLSAGVALTPSSTSSPSASRFQPGIASPEVPQHFGHLVVLATTTPTTGWLAALGERVLDLTEGRDATGVLPDGPGDLTVTVALGPRLIAAVDPALPGATALPEFAKDDGIAEGLSSGDVLLTAYASDPTVLQAVLDDLAALVPESSRLWEQAMFRGPGEGSKARNPLGFMDGIIVPHGASELAESVWVGEGALAGSTICVIRRLQLNTREFRSRSVREREAVIGRTLVTGAPLSGGGPDAQVDLNAKTPEGEFRVPPHAHARAAHPSFTGSALMLRRSYSFDNGPDDQGLVFISFQNELKTFVATQQRLDEVDALMEIATPTASGTFLVLPGFSREAPLGSQL